MSEMSDRVSRAILTEIQEKTGTIICNLDLGRVAIAAMQEPTELMLAAGEDAADEFLHEDTARHVYKAMMATAHTQS